MRLFWIVLISLFLIGIGSGVYMSLETMAAGLEPDAREKAANYSFANRLHGTIAGFSLPIATVGGLTSLLLAERRQGRLAKLALFGCAYAVLGLALGTLFFSQSLQNYVGSVETHSIVLACAGLIGLLLLRHPSRNASAFIFLAACLLPAIVYAMVFYTLTRSPDVSLFADTHAATSLIHAVGTALLLISFSALSVWTHARGGRMNGWVTALYVASLLVVFRFHSGAHFAAGMSGMPRRYADYPQQMEPMMAAASWYGLLYAGLIIFGLARFVYAVQTRNRSTPADTF